MKVARFLVQKDTRTGFGNKADQRLYHPSEPLENYSWGELPGSFVGEMNHDKALLEAGYIVTEEEKNETK